MRIQLNNGVLRIDTFVFQGKNGAIYLDWGHKRILLEKEYAESIAYDIPDFNIDDYNRFYCGLPEVATTKQNPKP